MLFTVWIILSISLVIAHFIEKGLSKTKTSIKMMNSLQPTLQPGEARHNSVFISAYWAVNLQTNTEHCGLGGPSTAVRSITSEPGGEPVAMGERHSLLPEAERHLPERTWPPAITTVNEQDHVEWPGTLSSKTVARTKVGNVHGSARQT